MAATLVGGAFLAASVQTLIDKLASKEFGDYITNNKLDDLLLGQLKTTLLTFQAVLDDVEEKHISNIAVKEWLADLKDTIFDVEDLLNKISTHSLQYKLESTELESVTNQVWHFLSFPFESFYREINSQMKKMCGRMHLFAQQRDILHLQIVSGRVSRRVPTSSLVNESVVVGRKDDKEKSMSMMLSDKATSNNNIDFVTILGMGGVGKTNLAQLLYNDDKVQQQFDLKAWVCVSEDFDVERLTKTLLESVTSKTCNWNHLDLLRVELKQTLRDKKILFVLDDVWNDNYNDWLDLLTPLTSGKIGSKVIITTRQQKVAEVIHTCPIYKVEPLSDEDCWSLLSKHAFGSKDFSSNYSNLGAIARRLQRSVADCQ